MMIFGRALQILIFFQLSLCAFSSKGAGRRAKVWFHVRLDKNGCSFTCKIEKAMREGLAAEGVELRTMWYESGLHGRSREEMAVSEQEHFQQILDELSADPVDFPYVYSYTYQKPSGVDVWGNPNLTQVVKKLVDAKVIFLTFSKDFNNWLGNSSVYLWSNEFYGAELTGHHFCDIYSSSRNHVFAYSNGRSNCDGRIDRFQGAIENSPSCSHVAFDRITVKSDWAQATDIIRTALLEDSTIDTIYSCTNDYAVDALKAVRSIGRGDDVIVSAYDAVESNLPELRSGAFFVDLDQGMWYTDYGFVLSLTMLVRSRYDPRGNLSKTILTPVQMLTPNMDVEVKKHIMQYYQASAAPNKDAVNAADAVARNWELDGVTETMSEHVGILHRKGTKALKVEADALIENVMALQMDTGAFEFVMTLTLNWRDSRLKWRRQLWDKEIRFSPDEVWKPSLSLEWISEFFPLSESILVTPEGHVTWSQRLSGGLDCSSGLRLKPFPFDTHICPVTLSFAPQPPVVIMGTPITARISDSLQNGFYSVSGADPKRFAQFTIKCERKTLGYWIRLIIPCLILNAVGFVVFFVKDTEFSAGVAMTTLLCMFTFKQTVYMPDSSDWTWGESFLLISVVFQFTALILTFAHTNGHFTTYLHKSLTRRGYSWTDSDEIFTTIGKYFAIPGFLVAVCILNIVFAHLPNLHAVPTEMLFLTTFLVLVLIFYLLVLVYQVRQTRKSVLPRNQSNTTSEAHQENLNDGTTMANQR